MAPATDATARQKLCPRWPVLLHDPSSAGPHAHTLRGYTLRQERAVTSDTRDDHMATNVNAQNTCLASTAAVGIPRAAELQVPHSEVTLLVFLTPTLVHARIKPVLSATASAQGILPS